MPRLPRDEWALRLPLENRGPQVNVTVYVRDMMNQVGPVMSWEDHLSRTPIEAAERAWELSTAHVGNLSGWMLEARKGLDNVLRGLAIGPGDWVEVDGSSYVCRHDGFDEIETNWDDGASLA